MKIPTIESISIGLGLCLFLGGCTRLDPYYPNQHLNSQSSTYLQPHNANYSGSFPSGGKVGLSNQVVIVLDQDYQFMPEQGADESSEFSIYSHSSPLGFNRNTGLNSIYDPQFWGCCSYRVQVVPAATRSSNLRPFTGPTLTTVKPRPTRPPRAFQPSDNNNLESTGSRRGNDRRRQRN